MLLAKLYLVRGLNSTTASLEKVQVFLFIPELKEKISNAKLFATGKEVKFKQQPEGTFIYLDGIVSDETDTIIQVELK